MQETYTDEIHAGPIGGRMPSAIRITNAKVIGLMNIWNPRPSHVFNFRN